MRPTDSLSNLIRVAIALTIGFVALLALDSGRADAAVFCVNKPNCLGTQKATIDEALDAAQLNGTTDSVFIGAKATPYTDGDGFSYVSNETVHIHGAGVDQTSLLATAFQNTMTMLSPASTIEGLTLQAPDMSNGTGLRWNGTASGIAITHEGTNVTILGSRPEGPAVLEDSTIDVEGGRAMNPYMTTSAVVRDTTIRGGGIGLGGSGASINLSRVSIRSPRSALEVLGNQTANVDNTLIRTTAGGPAVDAAISTGNGANVVITQSTLIGPGAKRGISVGADSANATVTVANSIITGYEAPLFRIGSGFEADLGVSYSNYDAAAVYSSGQGDLIQGAGNITNVTPQFRLPILGDFRLAAPSPLIDAADPNTPTTFDLDGNVREVDGDGAGGARADMGALEYRYQAPTAVIDGPASAQAGTPAGFTSSGSSDPDGEALSPSWSFGDGTGGQGKDVEHSYAAAGMYTVTLTVTDPAGRTATDSAVIQISPAPAGPGGNPNGQPQGNQPPDGQPPENQPPEQGGAALSDLRVTPKRIRVGNSAPRLVRGKRGGRIEFRLTADARVTLRFQRSNGGSARSIVVDALAGANSVRFQGRVNTRRALKPGRYTVAASVPGSAPLTAPFTIVGGAR